MQVRSSRDPNVFYTTTEDSCTCQGFTLGHRICRHIRIARGELMTEYTDTEQSILTKGVSLFERPPVGGIHAAIAKVYEKVAYVQKSRTLSTGQGGGYKFAGEADFIEALRPAMVDAGIYVHVNRVRDIRQEVFTSRNGSVQNRVTLIATIRFTHTDGSFIESEATGEGMDSGDKASNKAMTGALKYALRQTFCIETGTDPDDTPSSEQARDTAPRQNTPARAPERATAPVPAPSEPAPVAATSDGNAWKSLLKLMPEERVGKKDVERIINGWSPVHLDAWLDADNTRTVQFLILEAKGLVPA